jgi:hypothetical protein
MTRCRQIVFGEMYLSLYDGELVSEVAESIILSAVALQFGGGVPVIEVGNGATECVESGSGTDEEGLELAREWLCNVGR